MAGRVLLLVVHAAHANDSDDDTDATTGAAASSRASDGTADVARHGAAW